MRRLSTATAVLLTLLAAGCASVGTHPEAVEPVSGDAILEDTQSVGIHSTSNPLRVAKADSTNTAKETTPRSVSPSKNTVQIAGRREIVDSQAPRLPEQLAASGTIVSTGGPNTPTLVEKTVVGSDRKSGQVRTSLPRSTRIRILGGLIERNSEASAAHKPANYARASSTVTSPRRNLRPSSDTAIRLAAHEMSVDIKDHIPAVFELTTPDRTAEAAQDSLVTRQHFDTSAWQDAEKSVEQAVSNVSTEVEFLELQSLASDAGEHSRSTTASDVPTVTFRGAIKSAGGIFAAQLHVSGQGSFTVREGDKVPLTFNGDHLIFTVCAITDDAVRLESLYEVLLVK